MTATRRQILAGGAATIALASGLAPAGALAVEPNRVPSELADEIAELGGLVRIGNREPEVMLYEFFDYNCPWCRRSAADLAPLLAAEPTLGYGLVNFAILGDASVEASRVALAFAAMTDSETYLDLHGRLLALKGVADGGRALEVAVALGADRSLLMAGAASKAVIRALEAAVMAGANLGLGATPSYLIQSETYQGFVPLDEKRRIVAAARG